MKISMEQAFAIEMVYQSLRDQALPIKTAYKISKLTKVIEEELQFYRDQLQKIIDEYAVKDASGQIIMNESGTSVQIQPDKMDECNARTKELTDIEIDIDWNQKFSLDELESLELSLQNLMAFEPFIEE